MPLTQQKPRGTGRNILEQDLAPAVMDKAIQGRGFGVCGQCNGRFAQATGAAREQLNLVTRDIMCEKPTSTRTKYQQEQMGIKSSAGNTHHPPGSARHSWCACTISAASRPLRDMVAQMYEAQNREKSVLEEGQSSTGCCDSVDGAKAGDCLRL